MNKLRSSPPDRARDARRRTLRRLGAAALFGPLTVAPLSAQQRARVDDSPSSQELAAVRRTPGTKPIVAIHEFRSAVAEVPVGAALEMFVTALVKSGAFAVAERQRLNEGVMRERALQQQGVTTGGATGAMAGARYVFEVVVSEANRGAAESSTNLRVGGMAVGSGRTEDAIGLDVRIVDVQSGLVLDAVNAVKPLEAQATAVSGVGNLLGSLSSLRGKTMKIDVDADHRSSRKESVDRALRACIEVAVAELARRLSAN